MYYAMEYLPNGFTLDLPKGSFPLSTDSVALAYFAKLPRHARILDLGSGCGTLGLMLCAKAEDCTVTGYELDPRAHEAALSNIARNGIGDRMECVCADLRTIPGQVEAGSFSVCVSNPPYFSSGPASRSHPLARREDCCRLEDVLHGASWALKYGGDLFLVHRPDRLTELIHTAGRYDLEAKRLGLLRHRTDSPVRLILLQLRKGAKPGLRWEELALYHPDGTPTQTYREMYHLEEA